MKPRLAFVLPSILAGAIGASLHCTTATAPRPANPNALLPGELCDPGNSATFRAEFDPPRVVVARGQSRPVRVTLAPDLCNPAKATFTLDKSGVATAPAAAAFDLRHATYDFEVAGVEMGTTTLTLQATRAGDAAAATATLAIEVRDPAAPTCAATDVGAPVDLGATRLSVAGAGSLADASLTVPLSAFTRADEIAIPPFRADVQCGPSDLPKGSTTPLVALGPAVTFTPRSILSASKNLRREIDFAIPMNPAAMPPASRLRHVQVLFTNARAKTPRTIPVANPRIERVDADGNHVLKFSSPWFGTYQAVIAPSAGTLHRKRHLAHRAVMGISMGGGAAAAFGLRHHDKFDAIGALGGPSDWSWLLWYIENFHLGGFCPVGQTCPTYAPNAYPMDEPFVHTQDYNHWWYQEGQGTGGSFSRNTYTKLFWDVSAAMGNPNGQNADPKLAFFPAGPKATDPWVTGDTSGFPAGVDCAVPIDSYKGDDKQALHDQVQRQCYKSRCDPKNAWIAKTGYFDDEFNPDGTQQVISICDGAQAGGVNPYINKWAPPSADNAIPLNGALAVDLNKNGVRDENEPLIKAGHEPWDDCGTDGVCNENEPGYDAVTNPDPAQDDYDYQLNPNGTERDHRYQEGEPFKDYGLDGVKGTPQQSAGGYDLGEGDGKYTQTSGLTSFYAQDPHSLVHQWAKDVPGGPLTDEALQRIDVLLDGGVRDLFNFGHVANHLTGALRSRTKADGTPLKLAAYYNNFDLLPGQVIGRPQDFQPANIPWADVPSTPMIRYGNLDATPAQVEEGDGLHVGTGVQILSRIEAGFYFSAKSWIDADRTITDQTIAHPASTTINELGVECENAGRCEKFFTGPKTGRTGPIAVTLPPGYGLEENRARGVRYPVLYVLHGYGQDPRDLEAVAIITNNFMNDAIRSYPTRLPKFIVVYVDGRCRDNGTPECVRGTFYMDSVREGGAKLDSWFTEVLDYIDANYRTMPPSDVDVVE